ncbi:ABC transporter ATP-binding protein [Hamadaea tsunoensis]|uniref:ABC transporter ATP-binding protein n=1 Tax=Hamadaea tsunoensis TaxID=53368 RepID=UPI00041FC200|nr:ABC transporter ATP-binding protein [Hamadaea tsunoensis]
MSLGVEVADLSVRYGDVTALDGLSFTLAPGKIYGLLGRNGSGKSTLLSVLAAFRRPAAGRVLVDGQDPFENPSVMSRICLIREGGDLYSSARVRDVVGFAACVREGFDKAYADRLLDVFQIPRRRRVQALSRGQRSALGSVLGLASRAPLTILDEAYLGMDAPSRYTFYDALLEDYAEHPRTIILSTHLIEEVARLLEEVVIIDRGRLVLAGDTEDVRARGVTVTGRAAEVDAFTAGLTVLNSQTLGATKSATVFGPLDDERRDRARTYELDLGPVALQDLFVHLTRESVR